tara:strand:- start:3633 stop:4127 length:495 start_codon:yes stop_codon:yes gene_type:complete
MFYDCDRCGYATNKRSDFLRHLSRKEVCIAVLNNIDVKELKQKYQLIEPTNQTNKNTHPFECLFCNRRYKYKYNKTKHLKTCSIRLETELIQSEIESKEDTSLNNSVIIAMLTDVLNSLNALDRRITRITTPYTINMFSSSDKENETMIKRDVNNQNNNLISTI